VQQLDGRDVAESTASVADLLKQYSLRFSGGIIVRHGPAGEGFILTDDGTVLAAAFHDGSSVLRGMPALEHMLALKGAQSKVVEMSGEVVRATLEAAPETVIRAAAAPEASATAAPGAYDRLLEQLTSLPGVTAAALVADGLSVYQRGSADFEHVAAATEDVVRRGSSIAAELGLGPADQIILETPGHKVTVAPISDMFLCVLARNDANLGLIRMNIRSAQSAYNE